MSSSGTTGVGQRIEVTDPATGAVIGAVSDATREDVRAAIEVADRAAAV